MQDIHKPGRSGEPPGGDRAELLRWHVATLHGNTEGWIFVASGTPRLGPAGKVEHPGFEERAFRYPAQLDEMVAFAMVMSECLYHDVWATPGASFNPTRTMKFRKSLPSSHLWADLDGAGADDIERAAGLAANGGFLVSSGRGPGHLHAYIRLAQPVAAPQLQELNRRLVRYLHADASPSALNGYLRPLGTWNYKPVALGAGSAAPVDVHSHGNGDGWEIAALERTLPPVRAPQDALDLYATLQAASIPIDLPLPVRVILADPADWTGDRSTRLFELICACARGHLSEPQAAACALAHAPSRAKYGDRLPAEAARVIAKLGRASP
jgi:hypothetical protein